MYTQLIHEVRPKRRMKWESGFKRKEISIGQIQKLPQRRITRTTPSDENQYLVLNTVGLEK